MFKSQDVAQVFIKVIHNKFSLVEVCPYLSDMLDFKQYKYCRGGYFRVTYIFSLQFLILISRQSYCLQTRDITCLC